MSNSNVQHVVVDSGGFIKNANLKAIATNIFTIEDVVDEIRDKATRQRLQVLPYTLHFREPSVENVKTVTDFAKKTGDFCNLSATDIRVIALALQLEKEFCGSDHIRVTPRHKNEFTTVNRPLEKASDIAGFYLKAKKSHQSHNRTSESAEDQEVNNSKETCETGEPLSNSRQLRTEGDENIDPSENSVTPVTSGHTNCDSNNDEGLRIRFTEGSVMPEDCLEFDEEEEEGQEEDDDDDDDEGWITPNNIKQVKEEMGDKNCEKANVAVGCLTTDFAMQNVLIQMGLNVVSIDGMLIKQARSYVFRCYGCFKICTDMKKTFCPSCGNQTLQKISMTVDDEGNTRYYISRRRPICTKGMKYSLPAPKGGKHASNPILCADQRLPQQRAAKSGRGRIDVFDPDYVAKASPFRINDITSRAAQLGIRDGGHSFNRRNPNEPRKKHGRRK